MNHIETNNQMKTSIALINLYEVIDPEIGMNIVDLGLVYKLEFTEEPEKVVCTMTLTTEFCPMGESIVADTTNAIQTSFEDAEVEVNLIFEPPWTFEMISDEGKQFLGR